MPFVLLRRRLRVLLDPMRDEHVLEQRAIQHPRLDAVTAARKEERRLISLARSHICGEDQKAGLVTRWRPFWPVRDGEFEQRPARVKLTLDEVDNRWVEAVFERPGVSHR